MRGSSFLTLTLPTFLIHFLYIYLFPKSRRKGQLSIKCCYFIHQVYFWLQSNLSFLKASNCWWISVSSFCEEWCIFDTSQVIFLPRVPWRTFILPQTLKMSPFILRFHLTKPSVILSTCSSCFLNSVNMYTGLDQKYILNIYTHKHRNTCSRFSSSRWHFGWIININIMYSI